MLWTNNQWICTNMPNNLINRYTSKLIHAILTYVTYSEINKLIIISNLVIIQEYSAYIRRACRKLPHSNRDSNTSGGVEKRACWPTLCEASGSGSRGERSVSNTTGAGCWSASASWADEGPSDVWAVFDNVLQIDVPELSSGSECSTIVRRKEGVGCKGP